MVNNQELGLDLSGNRECGGQQPGTGAGLVKEQGQGTPQQWEKGDTNWRQETVLYCGDCFGNKKVPPGLL